MTEKERKAIEAEIQAILDQMWDAARKVDTDRMFASFSNELPVGFVEVGVFFATREAIVSSFREEFAPLNGQDIEIKNTKIAVLAPNVAIATQCCHFTYHFKVGNTFESDDVITLVVVKEGNGWKIIHGHHSTPISPED